VTGVDAIRLQSEDNVATVLRPVAAGETIVVGSAGTGRTLLAQDAIPMCHKISVAPIAAGAPVMKYGHSIGTATVPVEEGRHVHVHNLRSARARAAP
jgi:altronate dehydratase small subunit